MEQRMDYSKHAPEALNAFLAVEKYVATCGLEHKLIHLMKMRASQINGCAYCLDMHCKDARRRRDRATAVRAECMARNAVLQRTRGIGMDRIAHAGVGNACAR